MSLSPTQINRYARHLTLREIGGPAGLYLAAAGVGRVTLIDDDVVDASNLQRQVQFSSADVGADKAQAMGARLGALNPDCKVTPVKARLTAETAAQLLGGHDVILDGTDNFEARFAINAASRDLGIPLVSGALGRFDLQLGVFNLTEASPCYRCFVHDAPSDAPDCAAHGVLGAMAGMGGSMMAMEAVKHITGAGEMLDGRLYVFDALRGVGRTIRLSKDPDCPVCGA